jgi:hypothetical protein
MGDYERLKLREDLVVMAGEGSIGNEANEDEIRFFNIIFKKFVSTVLTNTSVGYKWSSSYGTDIIIVRL